ncbi:helix-turn-helix transcriptional regulator [Streptococcus hyointestinalis]|uniref:helix-turn-helix transcriptional regulator n=1 Tax=Streptococcus hyointestinalis TaxID=1337 RepID=UPI0023F6AF01|nr:YafY family protein [Streptococcus hyointestinalis]
MKESRLFRILYYLLEHKKATAPELAEEFEVSVRTIYRDIDYISSAGIPIYATQGKNGGIAILDSFTLDKSMFSEAEKEQILSGLEALIATDGKATDELLVKLKTLFQIQKTNWIEVDFSDWFQEKPTQNVFNDIKTAILNRHIISFEYFNHQGNNLFRHIQPLKLLFKGKAWYVYGFCLLRNEPRFFKLTRIKHLSITEEKFLPKDNMVTIDTTIEKEETITVTLKFDKHMAFRIYDEFASESIIDKQDYLIVTTSLPNNDTLYSYILSFEDYVEIIEPKEIRENMKCRIEKIQEKYIT